MKYLEKSMIDRIEFKLKQIQKQRPLSPSAVLKLREQFGIEMTYNSNAIEGNRLSLRETYLIINEGLTIKGKSLRDHLEAKGHYEALNYLYDCIEKDKKHTFSEVFIRDIQKLIVQNNDIDIAGKYRSGDVIITGASHKPPSALLVSNMMNDLMKWYGIHKRSYHAIEFAALIHHKIVHVHPFFDGNGRTARLVMNLLLMQEGYPLVMILKNDRKKYYQTLSQADQNNYLPFIKFIAMSVERSLNIYVRALSPDSKDNEQYFLLSELSKKTRYSEKYLNLLARMGRIEAHKDKRNWVASSQAIERYIKSRMRNRKI